MAMQIKDDAPYADFARRLLGLRRDAGMTRAVLAEKCGISAGTLINYENGSRIPFADTAVKMADALGVTVGEIMGVEEPDEADQKEAAVDRIRRMYGNRCARQAEAMIKGAEALFAGGELTTKERDDYILEMQKLFIFATETARAKFTPKKYRTEARATASRERLKEIDAIDAEIAERNRQSPEDVNPFLVDDYD